MPSKYQHKLKAPHIPDVVEPDWMQIMDHLRFREGFSMAGLSRACHCSRDKLYGVMKGASPPDWLTGACLLAIYREVT